MSQAVHARKTKVIALIVVIVLLIAGAVLDVAVHKATPTAATTVKSAQTTKLTYHGQDGQTALALLKKHAKIQTKTSSLGEYVTAINGNDGGGKKYWIFYVNGKEAQIGPAAYVTHNSDVIQWRLQ
jgi:hypothetical protein